MNAPVVRTGVVLKTLVAAVLMSVGTGAVEAEIVENFISTSNQIQ